jgi:hypothetical protein
MKERPILFNRSMVRAIIEGRKTQTRRIIKNQELVESHQGQVIHIHSKKCPGYCDFACSHPCILGNLGDKLWVKENFSESEPCYLGGRAQPTIWYQADNNRPLWAHKNWKPSIFMPRNFSRFNLEINEIKVERLQDISEEDALAEGPRVFPPNRDRSCPGYVFDDTPYQKAWLCHGSAKEAFRELWESIYGESSWDKNPFVWVVKFKLWHPAC